MTGNQKLKIAYQGYPGAFSHRAVELFAEDVGRQDQVECLSRDSFARVFESLIKDECEFGVVPLENSSVGSIVTNYDSIWRDPVEMVAEVYQPIHHNLLGIEGADLNQIKEVYSHPVALEQCRRFLATLPNAKPVSYWDTSASAFHVRDTGDKTKAAIASQFAARETGLTILARNVEDHGGNNTRFGVFAKAQASNGNSNSGSNSGSNSASNSSSGNTIKRELENGLAFPYKISIAAELPHEPGTLANLLAGLSRHGINLTKIESRPIPETPWHYRFFLDLEIASAEQYDAVVKDLQSLSAKHKLFGRYKSWLEPEARSEKV
ncbi:MAG TPA: prephenate dehydratase domain-containing protein [Chroococcales cyanobacterium]